jgi:hypothetical protein
VAAGINTITISILVWLMILPANNSLLQKNIATASV